MADVRIGEGLDNIVKSNSSKNAIYYSHIVLSQATTPQFCQSSFSSLLISLGAHLQHIEGNVLKNKNPYSAHNSGLLCL